MSFTTFRFDTCACIIKYPNNDRDAERKAAFVSNCRTHKKPSESLTHNRSFKNKTEEDIE